MISVLLRIVLVVNAVHLHFVVWIYLVLLKTLLVTKIKQMNNCRMLGGLQNKKCVYYCNNDEIGHLNALEK